jgi:PEP-CTERM motif
MISHRLLAGISLALWPLAATAVPVTYEFSGQIEMYGYTTPADGSLRDPLFPWATEISGFFTYESETPPAFESAVFHSYEGAITDATISFGPGGSLGSFNFADKPYGAYTSQSSTISIINDLEYNGNPPYDQFGLSFALGNAPGDPANMYRYFGFSTSDYSGQQIPTGQTLLDPLPVDAFLAGFHQLSFGYGLYDEAGNEIDSEFVGSQHITLALVPTSVPEPGTLPLLGVSLAGILLAMRRVRVVQRAA